jgi:signal transduction histidine kinase
MTAMPAKKTTQRTSARGMSAQHKAALAEGREQSRSVRRYLEALEANKPKRGRKRTPDSIERRLKRIDEDLQTADPLRSLNLRQERIDLQLELESMNAKVDLAELESEFVSAARGYSDRKGISYDVWRESGVPAAVLKRAGISRSAR